MIATEHLPVTRLTDGPLHHWFGYYDKFPWDATGRYVLTMEVDFGDRPLRADDQVTICMIDLHEDRRLIPLDVTTAWCWQMGAVMQWLNPRADREIIYNVREQDRFGAVVRDVFSGETRSLPRAVNAVAPNGRYAMCANFSRIADMRPGYGYVGFADPGFADPHPADDGIWYMDLETGENELVITLDQAVHFAPQEGMEGRKHWFNHLLVAPDSSRFVFLHRWGLEPGKTLGHRMLWARPDGSELGIVCDYQMVSHFDWKDADHMLAWARQPDFGDRFYLFNIATGEKEIVGGGVLTHDGHCSYSPDRRFILNDTYPQNQHRTVMIYDPRTNRRIDIGRFYSMPEQVGEYRCDLHPRWNREGTGVCIDSMHEGTRQMYFIDVSEIVEELSSCPTGD